VHLGCFRELGLQFGEDLRGVFFIEESEIGLSKGVLIFEGGIEGNGLGELVSSTLVVVEAEQGLTEEAVEGRGLVALGVFRGGIEELLCEMLGLEEVVRIQRCAGVVHGQGRLVGSEDQGFVEERHGLWVFADLGAAVGDAMEGLGKEEPVLRGCLEKVSVGLQGLSGVIVLLQWRFLRMRRGRVLRGGSGGGEDEGGGNTSAMESGRLKEAISTHTVSAKPLLQAFENFEERLSLLTR
jgi:hypothetical protein